MSNKLYMEGFIRMTLMKMEILQLFIEVDSQLPYFCRK